MRTMDFEEIADIYRKCNISVSDENFKKNELKKGYISNHLNSSHNFLYRGKSNPTWTNSVKK